MTEDTQTQIEGTQIDAAAGGQSAEPVKAPETAPEPEASTEAAQAPQDAPEVAAEEFAGADPEPVANPNALRGVPAGPPPHPRTV